MAFRVGSVMTMKLGRVGGVVAVLGALMCLGGQAHAADTLVDGYAGGMNFYPGGGDVIGDAATFDIAAPIPMN